MRGHQSIGGLWLLGLLNSYGFTSKIRLCHLKVNFYHSTDFAAPRLPFRSLVVTSARKSKEEQQLSNTNVAQLDHDHDTPDDGDELMLGFIQMIQSTPPGYLDLDDVDLLREIMVQFAKEKSIIKDGIETPQLVETLLGRLVSEWEASFELDDSEREEAYRPTTEDFEVAISAWVASENPDKVIHVLSLLSDQRELFMTKLSSLKPSLSTIKSVMEVLAKSRDRGIDKRATQVFDSLQDFGLVADAELYGYMVSIIAKSRASDAARRAEKMLRDAVAMFPPGLVDGKFTGIGVDAFNAVIVAYAKSGQEDGPVKAQELIAFMDQVDSENGSFGICSPNVNTFTSLIDAYCQQNEWESVSQADRMLNRLLEQYLEGNEDLEPNVATWTIVINAWGRLSKKNRRGAADRAGRLLRRMEDLFQDGRISCKPDAITYVTCMNAYAFSRGGEDAGEAEKLLEDMHERYLDGDETMKPSARSVRIVADAWIKAGDMDSAEQFLDEFEQYLYGAENEDVAEIAEATIDLYRSMLFGYTKTGNMERAKFYLDFMIERGMKPDNLCFDRLIEGYTKVGGKDSLKKSLQVFELLEKCRRNGAIKPNERVYTSFIRALTKGRPPDMHNKAETLLNRMHQLYENGNEGIKPTIFAYNAVLNACAESIHIENNSHDDAFKTAIRVFSRLREGKESMDHVTFGNLLRCAQLLPEGEKRDKYVSATFRMCCDQGFVNNFVLRDLQLASSEELWRSLLDLPRGEPDIERLPRSWSYRIDSAKPREREKHSSGRRTQGRGTYERRGRF